MRVLFIDGTGGFDPNRLYNRPTGGIITSLTLIPQYLARHGLQVTVASEHSSTDPVFGVEYVRELREADKAADVVIFNRNIYNHAFLDMFAPTSRKIWWLHDIVDHRYMEDDSYHRMDAVVALSDYCAHSYHDFYSIPTHKFVKIGNGADKTLFYPSDNHDKNLFVTASATVKGLYPLQFAWDNLKRVNPAAELRIYSSQKLHDLPEGTVAKNQLAALAASGATVVEPVKQAELASVFRHARAVLMPNHYPEICSNILLQAQACGTPVVATSIGSAEEYIINGFTGLLTKTKPHDMFWWWKDYASQVARIAVDDNLYDLAHRLAPQHVPSWDDIGEKWFQLVTGDSNGK